MRTYQEIGEMALQDYSIGLIAHYKPLANLINERGYKTIIEIGTAYAGNASYIIDNCDINRITCIDPYKYYPAMPGFSCQEEYDLLYEFARNRIATSFNGFTDIIRSNSKEAISQAQPSDLIFLDGSHEYEDVKWECENYSKLVNPGGVLSGHDYNIFEGVNKAVHEFSRKIGKPVQFLDGNIWYINF
jgi:predicted O-methyltransferase YrrM